MRLVPDEDRPLNLDFDKLDKLPLYREELPAGSFISVVVSPNVYQCKDAPKDQYTLGLNMYAVVLLRLGNPSAMSNENM